MALHAAAMRTFGRAVLATWRCYAHRTSPSSTADDVVRGEDSIASEGTARRRCERGLGHAAGTSAAASTRDHTRHGIAPTVPPATVAQSDAPTARRRKLVGAPSPSPKWSTVAQAVEGVGGRRPSRRCRTRPAHIQFTAALDASLSLARYMGPSPQHAERTTGLKGALSLASGVVNGVVG